MQAKPHSFAYVESDIPAGVTVDEWRRRTVRPARRRSLLKR
jgi:hypothetical protein